VFGIGHRSSSFGDEGFIKYSGTIAFSSDKPWGIPYILPVRSDFIHDPILD
jgi:hypothetical protein